MREDILAEVRENVSGKQEDVSGLQSALMEYCNQLVGESEARLNNTLKNEISALQQEFSQIDAKMEELKKEFSTALTECEDTTFKMNEKMIESIISKIKAMERELSLAFTEIKALGSSSNKPHSASQGTSSKELDYFRNNIESFVSKDHLTKVVEGLAKEMRNKIGYMEKELKEMKNLVEESKGEPRYTGIENRLEKLEEKIGILERIRKSGLKDCSSKNPVLSYFLSPSPEDAQITNRSLNDHKKVSAFDKKKIPSINLNSLGSATSEIKEPHDLKSRDAVGHKHIQDDSYTSFEEEFRFRLGRARAMGGDNQNLKLDEIKLSYEFSSHSKDGRDQNTYNVESEALSRKLFEDEQKTLTERNFSKPRNAVVHSGIEQVNKHEEKSRANVSQNPNVLQAKQSNLVEDYSAMLNTLSQISNTSLTSHAHNSLPRQADKKNYRSQGNNTKPAVKPTPDQKSSFLPAKEFNIENQSHVSNKENMNQSNSIRVIQEEGFDFEKWAQENELQITGYNLN